MYRFSTVIVTELKNDAIVDCNANFYFHIFEIMDLTLKEFLPLIGTATVALIGYFGISVQINKNRKAKWIEDFRKEVANFLSIGTRIHANSTREELTEISNSAMFIQMLLDSRDFEHRQVIESVGEMLILLMGKNDKEQMEEQPKLFKLIFEAAQTVIAKEQAKI